MVLGHGHPYGYPRPLSRYINILTDIRVDIRVELSVLRTVQPGTQLRPNLWSIPYRIITNKITPKTTISNLLDPDTQTHTLDRHSTIAVLLRTLFPRDDPTTDNFEHTHIR